MRADVCLHRNAAAIAAAEDDGAAESVQAAMPAGRGGAIPNPFAALLTPVHTELSNERIRFDPVRVFLGPAPGWKGPALGARPTGAATASDQRSRRPTPTRRPRPMAQGRSRRRKLASHPAPAAKAQKIMAAKAVKPKTDAGERREVEPFECV